MGLIFRWSYGVKLLSASVAVEKDHDSVPSPQLEHARTSQEESVPFLSSIDEATPESSLDTAQPSPQNSHTNQPLVSPTDIVISISPTKPSKMSSRLSCDSTHSISSEAQLSPIISHSDGHLQPNLQRPIFHSFPNVREYWMQSNSSQRNSIATSYTSLNGSVVSFAEPDIPREQSRPRRTSNSRNRSSSRWMRKTKKLFRWLVVRPALRINQFMTPPL